MTLEFWNLCNFFYSFENYLILIVSIVYSYIMLLHILISENFKLWAFWSLNTISWSSKCFLATGQFAYFGWVWYSYCCQNLAVFTEPCHTPAAGSCKTLVLLVSSTWAISIFHFEWVLPFPIKIYPFESLRLSDWRLISNRIICQLKSKEVQGSCFTMKER